MPVAKVTQQAANHRSVVMIRGLLGIPSEENFRTSQQMEYQQMATEQMTAGLALPSASLVMQMLTHWVVLEMVGVMHQKG